MSKHSKRQSSPLIPCRPSRLDSLIRSIFNNYKSSTSFTKHYHATTTDRLYGKRGIFEIGIIPGPPHSEEGIWTSENFVGTVGHAQKRALQRGGKNNPEVAPVVLVLQLLVTFVEDHDDQAEVRRLNYDDDRHFLRAPIPREYISRKITKNSDELCYQRRRQTTHKTKDLNDSLTTLF
tara:strand:+ start:537 stop:1070 length:534 start_codon:yes stop_codon:yes gene_type:complete